MSCSVELYKETVKQWAEEIVTVHFEKMEDVINFVEKMDKALDDTLTDETSILKRIGNWPKRYDTMREASGQWKQLQKLESTLLSWRWDRTKLYDEELERIRRFLEELDEKLQSMLRHQGMIRSYIEAGIPWSDALFDRVKAAALVPIEIYLQAVLNASTKTTSLEKLKQLFTNGANFAFKGHQLVGGFNAACSKAFAAMESAAVAIMDDRHHLDRPLNSPRETMTSC